MPIDFPASPANGAIFSSGGVAWVWSSAAGAWTTSGTMSGPFLPLAGGTVAPGPLVINANAAALPAPPAGTQLQIAAADTAPPILTIDAFNQAPTLSMRATGGTAAARTATPANNYAGILAGYGYTGSAYALGAYAIMQTTELWSASANGMRWSFNAIKSGTTGLIQVAAFDAGAGCQHLGTTLADSAPTGWVGEVISATTASNVAVPIGGVATNVLSLTLTPGDWDVMGMASLSSTNGATNLAAGISTVSATLPTADKYSQIVSTTASIQVLGGAMPMQRLSVAANTTIYLVAYIQAPAGTAACGGDIIARRRR